jgi:hypothetical protein
MEMELNLYNISASHRILFEFILLLYKPSPAPRGSLIESSNLRILPPTPHLSYPTAESEDRARDFSQTISLQPQAVRTDFSQDSSPVSSS